MKPFIKLQVGTMVMLIGFDDQEHAMEQVRLAQKIKRRKQD